ncbi:M15 family metallopeptidase [Fusobacterium necrophorum]|uniref:M15 family metallopeptidase n=1 Tax=Fusobacterium necrophorum TaxID=859 RepID=UPI00254F6331|nr:M15 family metallopeptidase [Fusobacterium necrophorum]MDK4484790.1 M15 family metallopeptidase [Fusobacterium necrophorum]
MYYFSRKSLEKLKGVHPSLVEFAKELILVSPYDFRIIEGVRTLETQKKYYTWGRTVFTNDWGQKVTKPVTGCDGIKHLSQHQIQSDGYSHAFDIAFIGKIQAEVYDLEKFEALSKVARPLMKKYSVQWGGDWQKYQDRPHWQLANV